MNAYLNSENHRFGLYVSRGTNKEKNKNNDYLAYTAPLISLG